MLKISSIKLINFSQIENTAKKFILQSPKFTSTFSYHAHYFLNHLYTIGLFRYFDSGKQYYILSSYHDPTRPLIVSQVSLNLNDDFLQPTQTPTNVHYFFPKLIKLVETPFDDHSRTLYTSLVHKHYSIAQLILIIAKLSSFLYSKSNVIFHANADSF